MHIDFFLKKSFILFIQSFDKNVRKILNQNARLNTKLDTLIAGQKKLEERIMKLEEDCTKHIGFDKTFKKVRNCFILFQFYVSYR
jgi:hypothetical protein